METLSDDSNLSAFHSSGAGGGVTYVSHPS